jgi:GT2 family glycosyltransferase
MNTPSLLDCAGGFIDYYGYPFERGNKENTSLYTQTGECFYGKGASLLLKREALEKSGLFDKDIFMYYDETDLCWRLRLLGYKIVFAPTSIVYHASGSTAAKSYNQRTQFFHSRNHLMIVIKNFETCNMIKTVFISIIYEIRNIFLFLLKRKPLASLAVLNALFWNLFNLKRTWKKRVVVQTLLRKVSDEEIKQMMLKPPSLPLYLIFSRDRYFKSKQKLDT